MTRTVPQTGVTLPTLATFPLQMRQAQRWLLWAGDKIPHYVSGRRRHGKLDTPADVGQLVDAKTAYAALKAGKGRYNGLGFALGAGWYGLDLDHVIDPATKTILPWADNLATACVVAGMYAEVSPSGTGLHTIGWWHEECTFRNGKQCEHVEAYHSGRYFTMTSNAGPCTDGRRPPRRVVAEPMIALSLLPALRALGAPTGLRLVAGDGPAEPQNDARAILPGKVTTRWLADRPAAVEALAALSSDCPHDRWRDVGLCLHHASAGAADGLALWEQWSAKAAGKPGHDGPRYVPGHCAARWASFGNTAANTAKPLTLGTLIRMAQQARPAEAPEGEPAPKPPRVLPGNLPDAFDDDELDAMDIQPTRWLVADLIAPGLTLLAAPPKAGKSYLALQMGLCVAAGKPFLDRETTASRVSYFDLEQWHGLIRPRRNAIKQAHAIGAVPLRFRLTMDAGDGALAAMAEEIDAGSKLIIVDLFARVRDELAEDAKKNAYARDYVAITKIADFALQHPEVAIVVIHHANKGRHDEWQAKISGSYGLTGGSHANVYMARPDLRGMEDDDRDAALNYRVLMAQGKQVEEQEVVIEKMAAGGGWQCSQMKPWEISATLLQTKIMLLLAPRYPAYTTAKEVADLTGRTASSVSKLLSRMAQRGTIESAGQGAAGYRVKR